MSKLILEEGMRERNCPALSPVVLVALSDFRRGLSAGQSKHAADIPGGYAGLSYRARLDKGNLVGALSDLTKAIAIEQWCQSITREATEDETRAIPVYNRAIELERKKRRII